MKYAVFALVGTLLVSGCTTISKTLPPSLELAQALEATDTFNELSNLPEPAGSIAVSVYSFRDQTGQYKPQANVSSFSTAVTQGANTILVQALHESDWFTPVEREGLQNILTERKIVRASLDNKEDEKNKLPPLTTAKIILEGGVISYDSNVKTGGLGMEYFGIGASELYREDVISIYLRAVDVRTGQVLLSVASTKKVLSQEMRAGFFRYVSYKRLAEAEAGFSDNEPMHICVKQAIEKALTSLVTKGIEKGIWSTKAQNQQKFAELKRKQALYAQQRAKKVTTAKEKLPQVTYQKVNKAPVEVDFSVQFRTNTTELEGIYFEQLTKIAELIKTSEGLVVELYGYADARGTQHFNKSLSKQRATTIAQYLTQLGVSQERISFQGLGAHQAQYKKSDQEGLFFDRRVLIKVKNKTLS